MARDKIKYSSYFQEFIQRDEKRIDNFLNKIRSGEISEAKIPTIKRHIFSLSLDLVNARYSSGELSYWSWESAALQMKN